MTTARPDAHVLSVDSLQRLIEALVSDGYDVIGPTVRDGAIVYDPIEGVDDLPRGWTDVQAPGRYQLERRDDDLLFGFAASPQSWKRYLFPPEERLLSVDRTADGFVVTEEPPRDRAYAFIGARACELAAIAVQDRVFMGGDHPDPLYKARREAAFIVAVDCAVPAGTCFCTSMGTGPHPTKGYDILLTELLDAEGHRFVAVAGSKPGEALLAHVAGREATLEDRRRADAVPQRCADSITKRLDTDGIKDLLYANQEHPRWDDVASRCLTCTNCTLVCPTCFCHTVTEVTVLVPGHAERHRRWDSCFTYDHSYIHGSVVHESTRSRYRQWMTHKLASWFDQFGTSGCVGCGRCIAWCPVGIDITEETAAIRASDVRGGSDGNV